MYIVYLYCIIRHYKYVKCQIIHTIEERSNLVNSHCSGSVGRVSFITNFNVFLTAI